MRQAKVLADNVVSTLRGNGLQDYQHKYVGSVASLGLHKGVAHIYGKKLKGYPAWFMHRAYHLSRLPTFNRKARVLAEWILAGLFKREIVSLGSLENPPRGIRTRGGHRPPSGGELSQVAAPRPELGTPPWGTASDGCQSGRPHWTCDHGWARSREE
ncbi:hypothetical protein GCM10020000_43380 [Streptomyces olivoverticillatus]